MREHSGVVGKVSRIKVKLMESILVASYLRARSDTCLLVILGLQEGVLVSEVIGKKMLVMTSKKRNDPCMKT